MLRFLCTGIFQWSISIELFCRRDCTKRNKESKLHIIWMWCAQHNILSHYTNLFYEEMLFCVICFNVLEIYLSPLVHTGTSVINYIVYMSSSSSSRIDTCTYDGLNVLFILYYLNLQFVQDTKQIVSGIIFACSTVDHITIGV